MFQSVDNFGNRFYLFLIESVTKFVNALHGPGIHLYLSTVITYGLHPRRYTIRIKVTFSQLTEKLKTKTKLDIKCTYPFIPICISPDLILV